MFDGICCMVKVVIEMLGVLDVDIKIMEGGKVVNNDLIVVVCIEVMFKMVFGNDCVLCVLFIMVSEDFLVFVDVGILLMFFFIGVNDL